MVIVVNTQRSRSYLNKALSIFGCPALLHFTIFAELRFHEVVFRFYTDGRERKRAELEDCRTVNVTLAFLKHGFDVTHHRFEILAFVEEHSVPVGHLIFPVLLPFAQCVFFEEAVSTDNQHRSGSLETYTAFDADDGIGRDMHVGDTIIGIKGRVGFEAAAPMLIIGAHRFLEKYTLSKWQQYWKDQVANWYGMFLHESQYLEPVMRDIEAMLQESQRNVNGTAILELRPLSFSTVGVESEDDLVKTKFGEYGEMQKGWTAEDAKGFIKVTSTPLRVYYNNHKDEEI